MRQHSGDPTPQQPTLRDHARTKELRQESNEGMFHDFPTQEVVVSPTIDLDGYLLSVNRRLFEANQSVSHSQDVEIVYNLFSHLRITNTHKPCDTTDTYGNRCKRILIPQRRHHTPIAQRNKLDDHKYNETELLNGQTPEELGRKKPNHQGHQQSVARVQKGGSPSEQKAHCCPTNAFWDKWEVVENSKEEKSIWQIKEVKVSGNSLINKHSTWILNVDSESESSVDYGDFREQIFSTPRKMLGFSAMSQSPFTLKKEVFSPDPFLKHNFDFR